MHGQKRSLLIVDDDLDYSELVAQLMPNSIETTLAQDGEDGIRMARSILPDVILLDVSMPKLDGISACKALRENEATRHIPIIFLSGMSDTNHRTQAFTNGADDFVQKPVLPKELVARVLSKIRRLEEREKSSSEVRFEDIVLDTDKIEAKVAGNAAEVSVLEFNILKYFLENTERVISRQQLLQAVWRDSIVSPRTVDTHMVALRKKLTASSCELRTIYGAGYILAKSKARQNDGDAKVPELVPCLS